jgi:hypothetical protein
MVTNLIEGEEVRVFGGRRVTPPGGWPGRVTRVGRKLCDIAFSAEREPQTFVMATGRLQYGALYHFLTLAQAAERDRRRSAMDVLLSYGMVISPDTSLTAEQIEAMAEIARAKPPAPTPDTEDTP